MFFFKIYVSQNAFYYSYSLCWVEILLLSEVVMSYFGYLCCL
jgi:hypothetical protein